jgi:hypothetical protein
MSSTATRYPSRARRQRWPCRAPGMIWCPHGCRAVAFAGRSPYPCRRGTWMQNNRMLIRPCPRSHVGWRAMNRPRGRRSAGRRARRSDAVPASQSWPPMTCVPMTSADANWRMRPLQSARRLEWPSLPR